MTSTVARPVRNLSVPPGPVLAFEDTGPSTQHALGTVPVIFSHGLFMDRTMFDPQISALAGSRRCITWDERSHGLTQWRGDYTFWDSADDLVALLDHLKIERAVLAGMSQGGILSLRAALAHPERVAGLVLIDTQAGMLKPGSGDRFTQIAAEWGATGPDRATVEWIGSIILGAGVDAEYWYASWSRLRDYQVQDAVRTLLNREDVTDRLDEIKVASLVIHGTADVSTSLERAEELAAGLVDCRGLVRIADAPHASNLSHPAEVNAAVSGFLDSL